MFLPSPLGKLGLKGGGLGRVLADRCLAATLAKRGVVCTCFRSAGARYKAQHAGDGVDGGIARLLCAQRGGGQARGPELLQPSARTACIYCATRSHRCRRARVRSASSGAAARQFLSGL